MCVEGTNLNLDMAAIKTFDLLVGVVCCLLFVWSVDAEIPPGEGECHQPVWILHDFSYCLGKTMKSLDFFFFFFA